MNFRKTTKAIIVSISLLIGSLSLSAQSGRTIDFPSYKMQEQSKTGSIHLLSVVATDEETRCSFEYTYNQKKKDKDVIISSSSTLYYEDNGILCKLDLQDAIGLPMNLSGSGTIQFELVFPALPSHIDKFDFFENNNSSWNLIDIDLTKSNSSDTQSIGEFDIDSIYTAPQFEGNSPNFFPIWVNQRLVYPKGAKDLGIEGTVFMNLSISETGRMTAHIFKSSGNEELDNEALRVARRSPYWTPGEYRGYPISVNFSFPVIFQLRVQLRVHHAHFPTTL